MKFVLEVLAVTLFYLLTDFCIRKAGIQVNRIDWWIGFSQGLLGCAIIFLIEGIMKK